jgi:hypothetical protein
MGYGAAPMASAAGTTQSTQVETCCGVAPATAAATPSTQVMPGLGAFVHKHEHLPGGPGPRAEGLAGTNKPALRNAEEEPVRSESGPHHPRYSMVFWRQRG